MIVKKVFAEELSMTITEAKAAGFVQNNGTQGFSISGGKVTINYYNNSAPKDVIIPHKISGYPVTKINDGVFKEKGITSVVIPDTVKEIGSYTFMGNELTSIELPDSVETVGIFTFAYNKINHVRLSENMNVINIGLFVSNELEEIELPDSITEIWDFAFRENKFSYIEHSVFQNIDYLANASFADNNLTEFTMKKEWTEIPFRGNPNLTKITVEEGNPNFKAGENQDGLYSKDGKTIHFGTKFTLENFPDEVEYIGDYAFVDQNIEKIDLKNKTNLKGIGDGAFEKPYGSRVNTKIFNLPDSIETIGWETFFTTNFKSNMKIHLPKSLKEIDSSGFSYNYNMPKIEEGEYLKLYMNDELRILKDYVFDSLYLTDIDLGLGVEVIEEGALSSNLFTNIALPKQVRELNGGYVFAGNMLQDVYVYNKDLLLGEDYDDDFEVQYTHIEHLKRNAIIDPEHYKDIPDDYPDEFKKPEEITFYGYQDSTIETYAERLGYTFKAFGTPGAPPIPELTLNQPTLTKKGNTYTITLTGNSNTIASDPSVTPVPIAEINRYVRVKLGDDLTVKVIPDAKGNFTLMQTFTTENSNITITIDDVAKTLSETIDLTIVEEETEEEAVPKPTDETTEPEKNNPIQEEQKPNNQNTDNSTTNESKTSTSTENKDVITPKPPKTGDTSIVEIFQQKGWMMFILLFLCMVGIQVKKRLKNKLVEK